MITERSELRKIIIDELVKDHYLDSKKSILESFRPSTPSEVKALQTIQYSGGYEHAAALIYAFGELKSQVSDRDFQDFMKFLYHRGKDNQEWSKAVVGKSNKDVLVWLERLYKMPLTKGGFGRGSSGSPKPKYVSASSLGVAEWGDLGSWLHRTQIPLKNISVQKFLNDKAKEKSYVKEVLKMDASDQALWILSNIPRVSKLSLGGESIVLTNRDGHADVYFKCADWMPKIWLYPILTTAIEKAAQKDGISQFSREIRSKVKNAAIDLGAPKSIANIVSTRIALETDGVVKAIDEYIKNYRYQLSRLLANDPMIIYMIKEGKDLFETLANFEIYLPGEPTSREIIETWLLRDFMAKAFPVDLDSKIRQLCKKVNDVFNEAMEMKLKSKETLGDAMTRLNIPKSRQDMIVSIIASIPDKLS